jgi:hypothetical protein
MTRPGHLAGLRRALVAAIVAGTFAAGCASGTNTHRTTFPTVGATPGAAGESAAATRDLVLQALRGAGLEAAESTRPHRPSEGPLLAAAPRTIVQVVLPDDPEHGFIVIYELASPAAAEAAARDQAAYIASNVGKVNFPSDSHFVIRVAGQTVLFFSWSPGAATDVRTRSIEDALSTVGTAVPIPA